MSCEPLILSQHNHVVSGLIDALPLSFIAPVSGTAETIQTPVDTAVWNLNTLTLSGAKRDLVDWQYFAIVGTSLSSNASITFRLYSSSVNPPNAANIVYEETVTGISDLIPLGQWAAGIDPYGAGSQVSTVTELIHLMPSTVAARRFQIEITSPVDIDIRYLMGGTYIQLKSGFSAGSRFQYLSPASLSGKPASGGTIKTKDAIRSRHLTLNYNRLDHEERQLLNDHKSFVGGSPFLVIPYSEKDSTWRYPEYTFLARYGKSQNLAHAAKHLNSARLEFLES